MCQEGDLWLGGVVLFGLDLCEGEVEEDGAFVVYLCVETGELDFIEIFGRA